MAQGHFFYCFCTSLSAHMASQLVTTTDSCPTSLELDERSGAHEAGGPEVHPVDGHNDFTDRHPSNAQSQLSDADLVTEHTRPTNDRPRDLPGGLEEEFD